VYDYIKNQPRHHKRRSYQDELRALLKRHRIEFDDDTSGIDPCDALTGLCDSWGMQTQGGAALCPGLFCPAPSGRLEWPRDDTVSGPTLSLRNLSHQLLDVAIGVGEQLRSCRMDLSHDGVFKVIMHFTLPRQNGTSSY
jgi:hypothetical protein